jgi:uncharacterized protein
MHLASQVFEVVTKNVTDDVRSLFAELNEDKWLEHWRSTIRMAALCHDLGHLPFSHAAEKELLPKGYSHERLSLDLIRSEEMIELWNRMRPRLDPDEIAKLAVGKRKAPKELEFTLWEEVLSEIIVGDAFGVDRIDYLMRDSLHAGVAYGQFDYRRLLQSLRILTSPPQDEQEGGELAPLALGVVEGGLHSAEALLLARYFMFTQVYFHPVRRAYDLHLVEFLSAWLEGGRFSTDLNDHLSMTDNEVLSAILRIGESPDDANHELAKRIHRRNHFKRVYDRPPDVAARNPEVVAGIRDAINAEFGEGTALADEPEDTKKAPDFPVRDGNGDIVSSLSISSVLQQLPEIVLGYVFVRPDMYEKVKEWIAVNRDELTAPLEEEPEAEG